MLIEFDNAHDAMLPYFDKIWGVIRGSWDDYQTELSAMARAINSPRTRASQIHDFMRARGTRLAETDQTIRALIHNQMFVLVFSPIGFNGCIGLRLKKLDEDGLSRNQPTAQVENFRGQLQIPEIAADYHLEAGYVTDKLGGSLQSIDWVCPSGYGNYWKAEIVPKGANQSTFDLFEGNKEMQNKTPSIEVIVRRKDEKEGKENDKGTGAT